VNEVVVEEKTKEILVGGGIAGDAGSMGSGDTWDALNRRGRRR
jgi:hypothetical protein